MVHLRSIIIGLASLFITTAANAQGLIATDRLLGRDTAGTGQVEQLTVNGALSFTGTGGITATGANIISQLTEGTAIDYSSATISWDSTEVGTTTWGSGSGIVWTFDAGATDPVFTFGSDSLAITNASTFTTGGNTIWHAGNDGSGSGLDADTIDSLNSTAFALTALSNLASVAINTSLVSDTDSTDSLGSNTIAWLHTWTDDIEFTADGTNTFTCSGGSCTIEGTTLQSAITDYVGTVADGTGIDGTASGAGSTYTPTLDLTEISSTTWGAGAFTTMTFDAGATDPVFTFGSNSLAISSAIVSVDQELNPDANDGAALGTTALGWSDLFLADGGVVNWGNGGVTQTHAAASDSLTIALDAGGLLASTAFTVAVDGGSELILDATNLTPGANDGNALGASGTAWADLWLAAGGTIEFNGATDSTFTCASGACTIEGTTLQTAIADYVGTVADGTGIDGTASGAGSTYTPTLDLTEISSTTWGAGAFTTMTFDAGATDPVFTFGSASLAITSAATSITLGTAATTEPLDLLNTTDAASVQVLELEGDRATMADNDEAYISGLISDDGGTQTEIARQSWIATDVNAATSVDGDWQWSVMTAGALADELQLSGAALFPVTNDGLTLGQSGNGFADLFLAAGGTIEWNGATDSTMTCASGHCTIEGATVWDSGNDGSGSTLDADLLDGKNTGTSGNVVPLLDGANTWSGQQTFGATDTIIADGVGLVVGHTAQITAFDVASTPEVQILGTSADDASNGQARFSNNGSGPYLVLAKSRSGTIGTQTIAQTADDMGTILFEASDGTGFIQGGEIRVEVDNIGSPGTNDMPTRMKFLVTPDGSASTSLRFSLKSDGGVIVGDSTNSPGVGVLALEDSSGTSALRFYEDTDTGSDYQAMVQPASITTTATCSFEDDANFIPDSCVGNGTDDTSDERLKKNFVLLNPGQVGNMLDAIKIYDYQWDRDLPKIAEMIRKDAHGIGPKAQELYKVNPYLVDVGGDNPNTDPWTWEPKRLVPYLLVEIQELRKRVAELEKHQ